VDDSHQGRQALSKGDAFVPVMNGQDLPVAPLIRGSSWQASGLQARWLEIHMKRPAAWALPERRILGVAFPAGSTGPKVHIVPISDCRFRIADFSRNSAMGNPNPQAVGSDPVYPESSDPGGDTHEYANLRRVVVFTVVMGVSLHEAVEVNATEEILFGIDFYTQISRHANRDPSDADLNADLSILFPLTGEIEIGASYTSLKLEFSKIQVSKPDSLHASDPVTNPNAIAFDRIGIV